MCEQRTSPPPTGHRRPWMVPCRSPTAQLLVVLAVAVIVSWIGLRGAAAATDAGEVLIFKGDCFKLVGDRRDVLKKGDIVQVGDVLEIPFGAKLKLRMSDGSVVALASGTRMTIQAY